MAAHTSRGVQYVEFWVYCAESATVPASSQSFGERVVKVVDQCKKVQALTSDVITLHSVRPQAIIRL